MLMTEQEARTKWCPKYQVCGEDGDNRPEAHQMENGKWVRIPGSIASSACCITSGCMAWRSESKLVNPGRPDAHWTEVGYCGAFGRPEV